MAGHKHMVLPPPYDRLHRHDMIPEITHDEMARFNFITNLNFHLNQSVATGNKVAFERQAKPAFEKEAGRKIESEQDVRSAMATCPQYQSWAALRRNSMEMRQQAGRSTVLRQIQGLNSKAQHYNSNKNTLSLNKNTEIPRYLSSVDNHCMPGSYYTELMRGDVSAGANYDTGSFCTTGGSMSCRGDGAARTIVNFLKTQFPDFQPKRILDIGAGTGVNVLPFADAFPDAEIFAVDVSAPMLRYGHARAQAMKYKKVQFMQMDGENLNFDSESFDWIQTTMFWHETSVTVFRNMLESIFDKLVPGGLTIHIEQPNFRSDTSPYDRFVRNWDAWYNNEPFWSKFHTMDVMVEMKKAGFQRKAMFEALAAADLEQGIYPSWAGTASRHKHEQEGIKRDKKGARKGEGWYLFGARKTG